MSKIEMNKKYQTNNGIPVRILCTDKEGDYPVVGVIGESVFCFTSNGRGGLGKDLDLIEVSPFAEFKDGDPVMVRDTEGGSWKKRYFAFVSNKNEAVFTYDDGKTKWSSNGCVSFWSQCRRPTAEELQGTV